MISRAGGNPVISLLDATSYNEIVKIHIKEIFTYLHKFSGPYRAGTLFHYIYSYNCRLLLHSNGNKGSVSENTPIYLAKNRTK